MQKQYHTNYKSSQMYICISSDRLQTIISCCQGESQKFRTQMPCISQTTSSFHIPIQHFVYTCHDIHICFWSKLQFLFTEKKCREGHFYVNPSIHLGILLWELFWPDSKRAHKSPPIEPECTQVLTCFVTLNVKQVSVLKKATNLRHNFRYMTTTAWLL